MKAEQLRKSILQLAIQGKLVKQDPNDEPASVLLERIRAEKQRLIKEGKIKKDKGDSIIFKGDDNCYYEKIGSEIKNIEDEIPFEIPDTWSFARFSSIIHINGGYAFKSENYIGKENGVRVLRISDFNEDGFNQKRPVYHKYTTELKSFELEVNDIIMCMTGGTVGKSYFVEELPEPMLVNQRVADIKINDKLNKKYCYYFILSPYIQKIIDESKNSTNDNISVALINSFIIPVPPIVEQERIVKEIERFEPLLAEYDKLENQATKLDNEIYDKLKKSILQYAIQGKLVEQDETDESASVLLERIRAEKKAQIGKKYVESYIYKGDDNCYYEHIGDNDINITEEIPYDLPKNWCWERIENIMLLQAGKFITASEISDTKDENHNYPCYGGNGLRGYVKSFNTKGNYCIIGRQGALCGNIKRANGEFYATEHAVVVYPYCKLNTDLLFCFLTQMNLNQYATATAQPGLAVSKIDKVLFALPPLAEQERIVNKINEIFAQL